jgi:hypothetical protein
MSLNEYKEMDENTFQYLLRNQDKWAFEYRKQEKTKATIRRILNRKFSSKQGKSIDWIKNELIKSLEIGELELKESLEDKGFDRLDF